MLEIRIHGRGGQGNVVAAYLLATAAIGFGRQAQAFPAFGAERRGAPVAAFVRIDDQPILRRCQVREPAFLIVQDQALMHGGVTAGLKPGGGVLVNWGGEDAPERGAVQGEVIGIPAARMALEFLGRPVPNTALLAAFLALTGVLPLQALLDALAQRFKDEVLENNRKLVEYAAARVEAGRWREAAHALGA